jgi:hypothetical protein
MAVQESRSDTSTATPMTLPAPKPSRAATADSMSARERAPIATFASAAANTEAMPRPIPLLPPVTNTDLPANENMRISFGDRRRPRRADNEAMASYLLNEGAVTKARALIDARQYVLDSEWGEVQPRAEAQNSYLESHSWEDYAEWHLGLTDGANDDTKARYAFVYGDFRRIHRTGLIACVYRASEWRHKDIELAAHDLLQHLDATSG